MDEARDSAPKPVKTVSVRDLFESCKDSFYWKFTRMPRKFGEYLDSFTPKPVALTDAMIERAAKSFYTSMYFKPASKERRAEWWDALTPLSREVFCDFARAALEAAFTETS